MKVLVTAGAIVGALVAMVFVSADHDPDASKPALVASAAAQQPADEAVKLPPIVAPDKSIPESTSMDQNAPYFETCGREGLSPSACVGRLIWFKATAGNERFHTYVFQQRVGVLPDWFRVLRNDQRDDRFRAWGLINDPSCCTPGDPNCPAKSREETYGFDWCPGDDVLLKYVGKTGYVDPACGLDDAPLDPNDPHQKDNRDQRQSACDLRFGTSTGALGFRKFPNPRFDPEQWKKVNGGLGTWEGFGRHMVELTKVPSDERLARLADASIEPPFLIGTSCGSCHIAFDPANPPADPAHPKWENIKGLVGNQYIRMSEILGSGMSRNSVEWQMFAHSRPGTTDTSAIPNDGVNNPGTINALINVAQRPLFPGESIAKWRKTNTCGTEKDEAKCWCEPGREGKCWEKSLRSDDTTLGKPGVHHILKGGEDSIGALEAIQRVYFNIGSCSEQCWLNHLTDMRQIDPEGRNFGQTPFNIGQCRRDCPNFRAIEDRLANILAFFLSPESNAADLYAARNHERKAANAGAPDYTRANLIADLEKEHGAGAVARGRTVFAANCARCHSSIPESVGGPFANRDFYALADNGLRADFMGNDVATPATEVGTYRCRALHSNHMAGHVWAEYGSETLRARKPDINIKEPNDGGRGYYRNISLLNLWAHAPFMHNNAIGPELCGRPANAANDFFRPRELDAEGKLAVSQSECFQTDPSVEGRYRLYLASMRELLYPATRKPKATLTDREVILDLGPRTWDGTTEKPLIGSGQVRIPAGIPANSMTSLRHKDLIVDLFLAKRDPAKLEARLGKETTSQMQKLADDILAAPEQFASLLGTQRELLKQHYSNCTAEIENEGHRFGEDLSDADKKALIAFLATL
ncbi:cytochrome c [Azoarcus sp. KH32C]|uniref:c-type cytochrome n=1 Tax=Azoarcus sp. KH32C TaxID=748247 RepID=UPI0002386BD2|nr:cytochrome c [Azoarcus sp. KH32C]BAL26531.1 hypothetical protein AZKH_4252 [Azoarcus sp. KH32C]